MIRALTINLVKLLQKEGAVLVQDIKDQVPVAEGKLKESIQHDVKEDGPVITLEVSAAPHFRFVEVGRKPGGKMPPLDAIRKWCDTKGIPVRAAFPIAKAIQKKGIRPKHILKKIIPAFKSSIAAKIKNAFNETMKLEAENLVKRTLDSKG